MTAFDGTQDLVSVYFDSDGREINVFVDAEGGGLSLTPEQAFEVVKDLLMAVQLRGRDDLVWDLVYEQALDRGFV